MRFAAEEQRVKVTGRTIFRDGIRYLGYTGTSISFRFSGKTAKAKLLSDASTHSKKDYAWVAVYVKEEKDGDVSYGALCDDKPYKRFPGTVPVIHRSLRIIRLPLRIPSA